MNGDEKNFLVIEFTKLKTLFDEKWKNHDESAKNRQTAYCSKFDQITFSLKDVCKVLSSLPCGIRKMEIEGVEKTVVDIRDNHLKHVNLKLNALLFTVLGSVFATVLFIGVRFIIGH